MTAAVRVGDLDTAYERAGDGPPLVLLHGILGDRRVWRYQLPVLARELTVIAWDAPGCGGSSDPPESFRMDDYADVLGGFLDALALPRAHVLGHSLGAALALAFYRRHAPRIASLLLADGYAGWRGSLAPEVCAERLASCLRQSYLPAAEFVPSWLPGVMTDFHPPGFRAMAHALAEADERDVLGRIGIPTLLLWGDADQRAPLAIGRAMHAAIPGSELAVVSGAGHASGFEQPEQFNAAVRSFLQRRAPRDR